VEVIESFGRFKKMARPGFHLVFCCGGQAVAGRLSTALQHQEVQCECKTRDGVFVELVVSCWDEGRSRLLCLQQLQCVQSRCRGERSGSCSSRRRWHPPISHTCWVLLPLPCLCLQFSVQYRVTDDRLYEAFFSLSNPASQVTSYGGCLPMDGCTHGGYAVCVVWQLLQLCPARISCGASRSLNLLAHEPHPTCILHFPRSSCLQCWTVWALLCPKWRLSSCSCTRERW
jgi:hypothetical protein